MLQNIRLGLQFEKYFVKVFCSSLKICCNSAFCLVTKVQDTNTMEYSYLLDIVTFIIIKLL